MSREEFEKAYQPDPRKSPFPFFKFNEETNLYEGYSFDEHEVALINAAWWVWQEQQKRIDELQLKVSEDSRILHNIINIERNKYDGLQARIDKALRVLLDSSPTMISKKAIKILKGGDE